MSGYGDMTETYLQAMRRSDSILADMMSIRKFIIDTANDDEWDEDDIAWFHQTMHRVRANARGLEKLLPAPEAVQ